MRSPSQFTDVKAVLDTAIAQGGARYRLPTKGKAVAWRQRAYTFRALLLAIDKEQKHGTHIVPSTPYDTIYLRIDPADPLSVRIEIRKPVGVLESLDGAAVPIAETDSVVKDDLLAEAEALRRELGL